MWVDKLEVWFVKRTNYHDPMLTTGLSSSYGLQKNQNQKAKTECVCFTIDGFMYEEFEDQENAIP